jgi:hypothetical protein
MVEHMAAVIERFNADPTQICRRDFVTFLQLFHHALGIIHSVIICGSSARRHEPISFHYRLA